MPRGYSRDLRERLLQAVTSGLSRVEIERLTGVSARSVRRWRRMAAAGVSLEPKLISGRPRSVSDAEGAALRAQVMATPEATLAEHCAQWAADGHAPVSAPTMCRALQRLGLSLKKRR